MKFITDKKEKILRDVPLFTKRILKEWCSHISLLEDNQFTWVMVHSIIS
jgi:hypothetical protein